MKELELEAEKYSDYSNDNIPLSFGGKYNESHKRTFIAGATSKYVEKQKLEFAIEQLREFKQHYEERVGTGKLWNRIVELQQQLNQL